jgi:hypothetical protein
MPLRPELNVRLPNSPGALSNVCGLLFQERVNILGFAVERTGHLRLVVDNPVRATSVLRAAHHQVDERVVVVASISNESGALAHVLGLVADAGFNVEYAYGSVAETAPIASIVLGFDDAARAAAAAGL